jgi:hypothetical protein
MARCRDDGFFYDDEKEDYSEQINNNLNNNGDNFQPGALVSSTNAPAGWEYASPDIVLAKLKQIKHEVFERFGLRPFYKTYNSWEKMTGEQRNKAVVWYRKLLPGIQGIVNIAKTKTFLFHLVLNFLLTIIFI